MKKVKTTNTVVTKSSNTNQKLQNKLTYLIKLGRPKFLQYSFACHFVGILLAQRQNLEIDYVVVILLQTTVWCTHLMTHYINEYGDYEVDKLNDNAGSWTGGSKVLKQGLLSPTTSLICGLLLFLVAFITGATCCFRYLIFRLNIDFFAFTTSIDGIKDILTVLFSNPQATQFVLFGLSVFFVCFSYSLHPFKFSSMALGEICVSYVLLISTPIVALLIQGGSITWNDIYVLIPGFIGSVARMIVMNIPDKEGDEKGNKITSVVLLGEKKAVILHNILTFANYLFVIPQLPISWSVKMSYFIPIFYRWWQSLRLNQNNWWKIPALADSIPFHESIYSLILVIALSFGLYCELHF